jgi:hypothetical protein
MGAIKKSAFKSQAKSVTRGAIWIGLILALCLVGLIILGYHASAQATPPNDKQLSLLLAPMIFNIDTLEVDHRMRTNCVKYLREGVAAFKGENSNLRVIERFDKRDLGYDIWRRHGFNYAGYYIPKKERLKAAGLKVKADAVITLTVHYQTHGHVRDNVVHVSLFCYDMRSGVMRDYGDEWEDIPIATAYYEVEDFTLEALNDLGLSPSGDSQADSGPSEKDSTH